MKKLVIGALVGGIIIFLWQFLSFTLLNLHGKAFQYTPKQEEILNSLNSQITEDGQYLMPGLPENATSEEHEALMKSGEGKPWALVSYHKAREMNMAMNMIRGLLVDIIAVGMLCWMLSKMNLPSFGTILTASIFTGLIVFLTAPYTGHIWYQTFDIMAFFMDAIVGWGACGLWLGWWFSRKV
ncbi:MAG: hypothetical protein H7122_13790 [Chitinophagaceae bacterium]|nr:hypothetical protein [Chitinophagaceae bacterium]